MLWPTLYPPNCGLLLPINNLVVCFLDYQADEWEIPRDNVEVLEPLGRGSFGMVYRGNWKKKDNEIIPCAIKTVTESNNMMVRHDFLLEANVMK